MKYRIFQNKLNESLSKFRNNVAIEYGNRVLTYGELDKRSNYIANLLIDKGVEKETFIGILMNCRMEFITTMIGILKAGCVFIPLDTANPENRLDVMINSTDTKLIISEKNNMNRFKASDFIKKQRTEFILIDDLFIKKRPSRFFNRPGIRYRPDDKIYIYFTSGTTGTPQAIVGRNKGLRHFVDWEIDTFGIDETFRVSQFTTPGFDAFLRDVFTPLCSGGVICIPDSKDKLLSRGELINWIDKSGIHLIHCVPSLFRLLNSNGLTNDNFKDLKFVLLSGERINPLDFVNWYEIFDERIRLVNLWGTSETTLAKTCYFIRKTDINRERVPVGKPIKGARVIILDKDMNICDDGVTGEIYIRTPFRTFGYYNNPALNKERFIQNPFNCDNQDDLIHKTGDLGRFLPDGNIDFLGRVDRQVKIRGYRIELEEIESVLLKHPLVKEAVILEKEVSNNEFLCGYVTNSLAGGVDVESFLSNINEYLSKKLPDYMVPAHMMVMEKIPRKPNGKIDYSCLPDPLEIEKRKYVTPRNDVEKKLWELWAEILGIKKIGIRNHFFNLGGNSLNIMSLISKIHKVFNVRLSLAEIFANPTIEKQAKVIIEANKDKYAPIKRAEKKEYYSLSSAQMRFYILHQMESEDIVYNITQIMELNIELDRDKVQKTFNKLIKRHESLRTSFKKAKGEVVQRIHNEVMLEVVYHDIKAELMKEKREENDGDFKTKIYVEKIIKNFPRPFDLNKAPLIRAGLIKIAEEKYLLIVDIHHIVVDGISLKILEEEFKALYNGVQLQELFLQYRDFSEFQNSRNYKNAIKGQEEYWLKKFETGIPVLNLPMDYPIPAKQTFEGRDVKSKIERLQAQKLKVFALEENVTLNMVLFAVFNILLSKVSGQEDIVIGIGVEGRRHSDLQKIIGLFVNSLALRNYPKKEKTFREFLREVKNNTLESFENQEYQFSDLVEKIVKRRDVTRNPIFNLMFSFHDLDYNKENFSGTTTSQEDEEIYILEEKVLPFDLILYAIKRRDELSFSLRYRVNLFREETIKRYIKNFKEVVTAILENNDIRLNDIKISSDLVMIKPDIPQTYFGFEKVK